MKWLFMLNGCMSYLSDVEKFVFITSVYGLEEGMDCNEIYKYIIICSQKPFEFSGVMNRHVP